MLGCLCRTIFVLALLTASAAAQSKLDLTATTEQYEAEGFLYQRLRFKDGAQTVSMELPRGWTFRSSAARMDLVPAGARFAEVSVAVAPLQQPVPLDRAAQEALEKSTLESLPPGSQAPEITERLVNPVLINGRESIGTIVAYKNVGEKFRRAVLVVNFPDKQLVVRTTGVDGEFDKLHANLRRALMSLHWSDPAVVSN